MDRVLVRSSGDEPTEMLVVSSNKSRVLLTRDPRHKAVRRATISLPRCYVYKHDGWLLDEIRTALARGTPGDVERAWGRGQMYGPAPSVRDGDGGEEAGQT
jgi:hypothetical protein